MYGNLKKKIAQTKKKKKKKEHKNKTLKLELVKKKKMDEAHVRTWAVSLGRKNLGPTISFPSPSPNQTPSKKISLLIYPPFFFSHSPKNPLYQTHP